MLICQLGLLPHALVSSESSDGKEMMRKGGNVFSGYRTLYKVENSSGIYNPTPFSFFLFEVTATSAKLA